MWLTVSIWTDLCKRFAVIEDVISDASSLSSHFHKLGKRTLNLNQAASTAKLSQTLRYITCFPVRWTQYVSDLFNVANLWTNSLDRVFGLHPPSIENVSKNFRKRHRFHTGCSAVQQLIQKLELLLNEPTNDGCKFTKNDGGMLFYGHVVMLFHRDLSEMVVNARKTVDRRGIWKKYYDNANSTKNQLIESFIRSDLEQNMLRDETLSQYLGIFANDQKKFRLVSGQMRILNAIAEYCKRLCSTKMTSLNSDAVQSQCEQHVALA